MALSSLAAQVRGSSPLFELRARGVPGDDVGEDRGVRSDVHQRGVRSSAKERVSGKRRENRN